ncbi:glycosyltransferase family 39 protein [Candidatus Leptofilum sp.]|uniref:glycosyltransferase family 39 protein n=1 Tax=Candidatus Leptofilum sp. TaxID=3241576 RepID=UPI003B58FBB4
MEEKQEKRWLRLILGLFIILGGMYALVTPVFEASDELWHYPMIRHLADGNPLPVQVFDPAQAGPWKQEASQPPLYYYLGAALTFWIDTNDMETVRWENPHVDNGILTADGNINLTIKNPAWSPWQGTLLAVRIVRLFSVLLGATTVYLTYLIGKELALVRPEIALGAAALNAFTPMFLFISGAVNNDNLAIPLSSLGVLLMIRAVSKQYSASQRRTAYLKIGVVIGLAILTKQGAFALLPLALGAIFIANWGKRNTELHGGGTEGNGEKFWGEIARMLGRTAVSFLILLIPVILIAGWWYWRNIVLYGDFLGWNAFIAVLGQRAHPASLAQLWSERWGFMLSYWGLFGGVNVPMPLWLYHVLNGVVVVGVLGFVVYFVKEIIDWRLETGFSFQSLISNLLNFVAAKFALVVCLLFMAAVIVGLIQWATTTWSSQGRLVFTAMSAINVLLVAGLIGWLPRRFGQRLILGVAGFLFVLAALAPLAWIRPAYAHHQTAAPWLEQQPMNATFDGKLRLVGYEIGQTPVLSAAEVAVAQQKATYQPGDTVDLLLEWEVLESMDRNWSVFVHLNDPVIGVPIAQRDMFLDQGLRPTSLLEPGETIFNHYQLVIPETAVAPANLQLTVGLYDFANFERLPLTDGADSVVLATLTLEPAAGDVPNPTLVNFDNELELVGFELNLRQAAAGETVDLTLYWRAKRPLTTDYTIFAQVVDDDTTRWASQDLGQPTSSWAEGELQTVQMSLPLSPDTPSKVYPVIIGLYTVDDGQFNRLQIIAEDGRPTDDFLRLTLLRVND